MRHWSATIKNFYKGRYWNNEQVLAVKATKVNTAVHRAVGRYLESLPKGTRIEGLSINIQAIKVKKEKKPVRDEDLLIDIFSIPAPKPKKRNPRQRDLEKLING